MTRHSPYHGDNMSRLAPPSELSERHSSCEIRSFAEGGRSAPMLQRGWRYLTFLQRALGRAPLLRSETPIVDT
jgi:hypothetical protein